MPPWRAFLRAVPAAVPGIAFLSGGQPYELASARLNAMNLRFETRTPWALLFSFSPAIQNPALEIWKGQRANEPGRGRLCIIEPRATVLHALAGTGPRWNIIWARGQAKQRSLPNWGPGRPFRFGTSNLHENFGLAGVKLSSDRWL